MYGNTLRLAALLALAFPAARAAAVEQIDVPQSPREWTFHLQIGGYLPDVDSGEDVQGTPFRRAFGTSNRLLTQAGLERYLFDVFGTLGLGVSVGYSEFYGRAFFREGPQAGERSGDPTSLHVVPLQVFAAYRFDVPAQAWDVPLVPYAKAGIGTWFYWSDGDRGQRAGFSYGGGLQLLLDFFDPRLANEFDRNVGVNNSYLFVDWAAWQVDGFGSDGLVLSDDGILSFGLALDF